ncbi:MAG: hypothetical protein AAGJ82_05615, partial [Bacteroidota bacterium]
MLRRIPTAVFILGLSLVSLLLQWDYLDRELTGRHSWRQTHTVANIDNFYAEDFHLFHPRRNARGDGDGIFRMEFPLMQWLTASLYKTFGPSLQLARLFNFALGVLSLFGLARLLWQLTADKKLVWIGCWLLAFSPSFFYYHTCPMPDNLALTF